MRGALGIPADQQVEFVAHNKPVGHAGKQGFGAAMTMSYLLVTGGQGPLCNRSGDEPAETWV